MNTQQYIKLIVALMDRREWHKALNISNKLLEKDPKCDQVHFLIGMCLKHTNDLEGAKDEFNICIKENNHFLSYINLIRILKDQNKFIEAYEKINIAKDLFPDKALVYIESSQLYLKINNIDLAIVDIKTAITLEPRSETAHYTYGVILNNLFNNAIDDVDFERYYRETLIQYMNVFSINMSNIEALCNYGAVVAKYANKYNTKADILLVESETLLKENRLKESNYKKEKAEEYLMYAYQYNMEAETKYKRVLELNPFDHIAHFNIGLVLKYFGDIKKARYHFAKVIAIDPSYTEAEHELKLLEEVVDV
jgi:tetratricopeptide (TPR) repeat protein